MSIAVTGCGLLDGLKATFDVNFKIIGGDYKAV